MTEIAQLYGVRCGTIFVFMSSRGFMSSTRGCMIKIFRGGGVVDEVGGSSERCLKWGGGGWGVGVIKGSFQKHLKIGGWVKAKVVRRGRGF